MTLRSSPSAWLTSRVGPILASPWGVLLLVLLPAWIVGVAGRGMWTPDEPREFDLALSMYRTGLWSIPQFLGAPFCEKPPLTYWASAGSMHVLGATHIAARLPDLLWAVAAYWAVYALGRALAAPAPGRTAGMVAGAVASSFLLVLQRQVWLATDAPLFCATALALLGIWWGLNGGDRRRQCVGFALLGIGLTSAFLAKNTFGWLVPGFALFGWCLWMQRPQDFLRPALWVAGLVSIGVIAAWLTVVGLQPGGSACLRTLLWANGLGRLLPIDTPQNYSLGHQNWFGKYILQMPWLLFPWTALALASVRAAMSGPAAIDAAAWRFCAVATLPAWGMLFLAATGRDVYFLPSLIGVACAIGLWAERQSGQLSRLDHVAMKVTEWVVGAICVVLAGLVLAIAYAVDAHVMRWQTAGPVIAIGAIVWLMTRPIAILEWRVTRIVAALCGTLVLSAPVLFPMLDTIQDLAPLVRNAAPFIDARIVTLASEETIQAYLESELRLRPRVVPSGSALAALLASEPTLQVLVRSDRDSLRRLILSSGARGLPVPTREVQGLLDLGLVVKHEWGVPGGRSYALMGLTRCVERPATASRPERRCSQPPAATQPLPRASQK